MQDLGLLRLDPAILRRAAELDPAELRSIDAVHVATAEALGDDLEVLIAYDRRLLAAAAALGLATAAPG